MNDVDYGGQHIPHINNLVASRPNQTLKIRKVSSGGNSGQQLGSDGQPIRYFLSNKAVPRTRQPSQLHACNECGKMFTSAWGLRLHQPLHTGQWKYVCQICDRGFMETKKFNAHVKSHKKTLMKNNLL